MAMETRPISSIKVGGRIRKDLGDLDKLVASIEANGGLLQPILINSDGKLIAGFRRYCACKKAGREMIEVNVRDDLDSAVALLIAERDENTCRKDFTPSEMVAMGRRLEELERPAARERIAEAGRSAAPGRPAESSGDSPELSKGETREKVAAAFGVGGKKYEHAKKVVEAAEEGDPVAEEAVEEMDATGKVEPAYRKVAESSSPPAAVTNGKSKRQEIRENAAQQRLTKALIALEGLCDALEPADLSPAISTASDDLRKDWRRVANRADRMVKKLKQNLKEER